MGKDTGGNATATRSKILAVGINNKVKLTSWQMLSSNRKKKTKTTPNQTNETKQNYMDRKEGKERI